jgi:tetratricopeptide (TPR) repeat protein
MTPLPLLLALGALCAPQDPALDKALATAAKYATQNNFQAALAALEGAGANTSDDPVARTQYGVYRMRWLEDRLQRNDPEVAGFAAIDAWNEIADAFAAVTRLPGANDEPWEHWSECLLNASDLGQALSVADDGVSEHRDSVRLQLQRGRVLMALARKAAEIGRTEEETKRYDEAEAAFRTAMEKGKKSAAPCLRLAELKITRWAAGGSSDAKLRAEAVALWTEAVQREPGGVDLGATYAWLGADAVAPLDAFLEAKPDHLDAIWFRGLAHWAANPVNWPGARDDLMKVVEKNPTFYDAYFYLGDAAMRRGEELSAAQPIVRRRSSGPPTSSRARRSTPARCANRPTPAPALRSDSLGWRGRLASASVRTTRPRPSCAASCKSRRRMASPGATSASTCATMPSV